MQDAFFKKEEEEGENVLNVYRLTRVFGWNWSEIKIVFSIESDTRKSNLKRTLGIYAYTANIDGILDRV